MRFPVTAAVATEVQPINRAAVDRVRFATRDDADEIMAICCEMALENGQMTMSERKVRGLLEEAFSQKGGIIGVIGNQNLIQGCICMRIGQLWYSEDWMLSEYFSYVRPQYRRSTNLLDLVEFAKDCAHRMQLKLFISMVSTTRTEAKVRLFERRLSKPAGALFIYDGSRPSIDISAAVGG